MACENDCPDCDNQVVDCERAKQLRCKAMAQLEMILCAPAGPTDIEGVKYESKGAAIAYLRELMDWTYLVCQQAQDEEGPMIEWVGPSPCGQGDCCG